MTKSLYGRSILVTRPEHQADNLVHLIEEYGGIAVRLPSIAIVETQNGVNRSAHFGNPSIKLSNYQLLIFTSVNAVNFAVKANGGKIAEFNALKVAAIGQATAKALQTLGVVVHFVPERGYNSEALLDLPELHDVRGKSILIARGQGGREELANILNERGASVDYWEVYKRIIPEVDGTDIASVLSLNKVDAIVITSGEALKNLATMLGVDWTQKLVSVQLVTISERIRKIAEDMGFLEIAVTEIPSDDAIVETLIAVMNK